MNSKPMLKYIISSLLFGFVLFGHAQDSIPIQDTLKVKLKYGIRVGFDISRPLIQTIQKQDLGFEITGDYRVAKNWFVATEFGYASEPGSEDYITFHTKGSYAKIGFNYNTYENWAGMDNEIYAGLRYGFSSFQQQLISYTTLDLDQYFGGQTYNPNETYSGLTGHWAELNLGMKVEILNNLYLTTAIQFKKLINSKQPEGFSNLYIPGFNKVLLNNNGIGFNYTISYLIPLYKK